MKLFARLQAMEKTLRRERLPVVGVCDRIDELARMFEEQPPTFSPATEAGILAAVERHEQACQALASSWNKSCYVRNSGSAMPPLAY